jgi:hypothetical protein
MWSEFSMRPANPRLALLLLALMPLAGCGDDDDRAAPAPTATTTATTTATPTATAVPVVVVFNGEANRLNAYEGSTGVTKQTVIQNHALDPNGRDINGQICFHPDGSRRFIAGEDTGQPNPPQGWGFFQLEGTEIGSFSARQIGKLTPTYQGSTNNAENYGCGFLSDGRLVTSDVGNQDAGGPSGQLIVWFPPFDQPNPRYCKLDVAIGTAGGIWVDDEDNVYLASARVTSGVWRYSPPFPTSDDAAGGCSGEDSTGAPFADQVQKERFIAIDGRNLVTPNAVVQGPDGHFFVSSVLNGVIAEYDEAGTYIRRALNPVGATLPYATGTPLGLGISRDGTLYYADIGLETGPGGIGPGDGTGTVRRIRFEAGEPLPPETMDEGLNFPDGIGILE